jgi:hypothetical protein
MVPVEETTVPVEETMVPVEETTVKRQVKLIMTDGCIERRRLCFVPLGSTKVPL